MEEKMNEQELTELLVRFHQKETSDGEDTWVQNWVKEDSENKGFFNKVYDLWLEGAIISNAFQFNIENAWEKLSGRVEKSRGKKKEFSLVFLKKAQFNTWKIAASIAVFTALTLLIILLSNQNASIQSNSKFVFYAPKGEKSKIALSDGSIIWLNSGSKLIYKANFNDQAREVYMEGEGYFQIAKNKDKPFRVKTSQIDVIVYGTKFNLYAYPEDNFTETTLEQGSVKIKSVNGNKLYSIKPGFQAVFSKQNRTFSFKKIDTEIYTSWKENKLRFDNAPFGELVKKLERWYDVSIILDNSLKNTQRYTMTVETESLREVLEYIKIITPIKYKIQEEKVFINQQKK